MSDIPVVFALDTASVAFGGGQAVVHKGQHWAATDPLVQQYPHLFTTDPRYGMKYTVEPVGFNDAPVEQATAAPGEKRSARRTS